MTGILKPFEDLINALTNIVGTSLSTLLMGLAFIAFLIAVINFILKRRNGDANGLEQSKNMLWWSVVGLFIMVSVWGLVNFIQINLLGADGNKTDVAKPRTNFGTVVTPTK